MRIESKRIYHFRRHQMLGPPGHASCWYSPIFTVRSAVTAAITIKQAPMIPNMSSSPDSKRNSYYDRACAEIHVMVQVPSWATAKQRYLILRFARPTSSAIRSLFFLRARLTIKRGKFLDFSPTLEWGSKSGLDTRFDESKRRAYRPYGVLDRSSLIVGRGYRGLTKASIFATNTARIFYRVASKRRSFSSNHWSRTCT